LIEDEIVILIAQNTRPKTGERTGRQKVVTSYGGLSGLGLSTRPLPASYDTYRRIRKDPTVAMARALSIAPILAAEWSVESDDEVDDERIKFIRDQFLPIRESFLEATLFGGCDFGHQPFEKVFGYDSASGRTIIKKFKPLLQDLTEILVEKATGAFHGFRQKDVIVPLENSLLIPFRVEGTNWYGEPLLENARKPWSQKEKASGGAERYDEKVAGAHWVVWYPIGETEDENGTAKDNADLARDILTALEASGSLAVPRSLEQFTNELQEQNSKWKIELLADNGARQPTFVDRLDYLDKQLVRALLLPERAVLEGTYGTKAEAESHGDLALTVAQLQHQYVTRLLNWHAVDQVLALNYGKEARGTVWLKAAPIVDERIAYLKSVYDAVLTNPNGFLEEFGKIDTDSLKEQLGVPKSQEVDDDGMGGPVIIGVEGEPEEPRVAASIRRMYRELGIGGNGS
jgi:hypothetical protein